MGTTANALELSYSSRDQIPRILEGFASYCVAAATVDPKYCPLAAESMKFKDPVSDVIGRVRRIIANLTMRAGVPATAHPELQREVGPYTFSELVDRTEEALRFPEKWPA